MNAENIKQKIKADYSDFGLVFFFILL